LKAHPKHTQSTPNQQSSTSEHAVKAINQTCKGSKVCGRDIDIDIDIDESNECGERRNEGIKHREKSRGVLK
jgi:hypothetical protein